MSIVKAAGGSANSNKVALVGMKAETVVESIDMLNLTELGEYN